MRGAKFREVICTWGPLAVRKPFWGVEVSSFKRLSISLSLAASALLAAVLASGCAMQNAPQRAPLKHWSTTWGASETAPAPDSLVFSNQTLRLIVHTTTGGNQVRIKLTNVFGSRPLSIGGASVALQESGATLMAGSNRALTFSGRPSIVIPIGAYALSDSVPLSILPQHDLAVSLFVAGDSGPVTMHPLALQTSFVSTPGDFVARDDGGPFQTPIHNWPYLAAVEVNSTENSRSIVAFGDSITDGYRSTADSNHRWPDYLSTRLAAAHRNIAVVNEGIGGNRIWHDAIPGRLVFGPNGLSRFDRDAITVTGTSHIVVLLGINDIGQAGPATHAEEQVSAEEIIVGLKQLALRAHAHGIRIIGGTLTPYRGAAYFDAQGEEKRERVNAWIRTAKEFDGVIDFDAAIRDPAMPTQIKAAYDSGDHLHPSDEGYKAMAGAISLALFD
jgi:lysophospholipase L1-like esterase